MDKYFDSESFRNLLQRYEDFIQTGGDVFFDADELTDIAEYYHIRARNDKALRAIKHALHLFPGATMPLVFMARLSIGFEVPGLESPEYYLDMVADQSDIEYLYAKAEVLISRSKAQEANDMLYAKINEWPFNKELEDYALDIALIFCDYDMYNYAEEWLHWVHDTTLPDYKEAKARILAGNGLYEESETIFNKLIDDDPYSTHYWNLLAKVQSFNGNIQGSITSSEYAIAIDPDNLEALLNKANQLFTLGNYDEAQKVYKRYGEIDTQDCTGDVYQALCLINTNRPQEAIEYLKKAEEFINESGEYLHRYHEKVYQELAFAYSRLGQVQEALAYTDLLGGLFLPDKYEILVIKGHIYLENGFVDQALDCFQQVIKDSKMYPFLLLKIAISVFDCGYMKIAFKIFTMLFQQVWNEWEARDTWRDGYSYMARCCYDLRKMDEFRWYLRMAVEKNPKEAKEVLEDLFPDGAEPKDYLTLPINGESFDADDNFESSDYI